MSKELESFNIFKTWYVLKMADGNQHLLRDNEKEMLDTIEQALKEYATLNEELGVALSLNECQNVQEWISLMKKKLKDKADQDRALKLIIEKGVDMELLKKCGNAVSYNSNVYAPQTLKIDDYVFLKEFVSKYGAGGDQDGR